MAPRPAAKVGPPAPAVSDPSDWQTLDPGDWQEVGGVSPAAQAARSPGFLESAGNVLKGAAVGVYNDLRPHSRAEKQAAANQAVDLGVKSIQGTPEEKSFARDQLISGLPLGGTYLKAREGNYAGAAGDVAGLAALGLGAKIGADTAAGVSGAGLKGAVQGATKAVSEIPLIGHAIKIPKAAYEGYQTAVNPPRSFGPGNAPNPASPPSASIAAQMAQPVIDFYRSRAPNPGPGAPRIPNVPPEGPSFGPNRGPNPARMPPRIQIDPEATAAQGAPNGPAQPAFSWAEMNRMVHARAHEMELPGSPAGTNGHPNLSEIAKKVYGVKSWGNLSVDQMNEVLNSLTGQ